MTATFLDNSFLPAADTHHERTLGWQRVLAGRLVTTKCVFVEVVDALADEPLRSPAMFEARPDKPWGLTDCVSFIVMQRAGMRNALTSDRHFEQAGFRALLRMEPPGR